jgi:hypothetical protein
VFFDAGHGAKQFWLSPVQDAGRWRLYAGEWKRSDAIAATVNDDRRVKTAIAVEPDAWVIEALIPVGALGATPAAGATWRWALKSQTLGAGRTSTIGWPVAASEVVAGAAGWGEARFGG